jgi:hypothetical protein
VIRRTFSAALALLIALPSFAAELELRYAALERIVGEQLFSQDGRHYVRGDRSTKCQFAYLESPHVAAENGRLRVTARFSGRSALDVFGRCVGLGDSFDLTLTGSPRARNGALIFENVDVTTVRDSYYIRRVRKALTSSFSKDFKIEVRDQARRLLEQQPPGPASFKPAFQQEMAGFELGDVQVHPDALVLVVEFRLVVK